MLDGRLMKLLEVLMKNNYITAKRIAEIINVSEKTIRIRMKALQYEVAKYGAEIEAKQRSGYRIKILDKKLFMEWKKNQRDNIEHSIPDSPNERRKYLLNLFLMSNCYFKLEDISEKLCVSTKTLSGEIKKTEYILKQYNINVERRPSYGMRAVGDEFNFRKCIMNYIYKLDDESLGYEKVPDSISGVISKIIVSTITENNINLSELSFMNLLLYLYVVYMRTKDGHFVKANEENMSFMKDKKEFHIADILLRKMNENGIKVNYSVDEVFYIGIYISGKRMINSEYDIESNFIIPDKIDKLVFKMLSAINEVYGIDFSDDLNTRMFLNQHMMPFDIRMQYDIPISNPLIDHIKKKYSFAYTVAQVGIEPICKYYGKKINDDEIGYFAIILEMALERNEESVDKKNILLVCVTGKASSQFLLFKFKKEFGNYINNLNVCSLYEIEEYDLSNIDYIFSTVPIKKKISVPIFLISNFLERDEIITVREKLQLGNLRFINNYYRKDLFFTDLKANTKEEAIAEMCKRINEVEPLPDNFYDSVIERENLGNTDFGSLFAIPHPKDILIDKNLVSVGILEKPIIWAKNQVQFIIIVSVYDSTTQSTQKFYHITTELLSNDEYIKEIIKNGTYEKFIELLNK